MLEKTTGPGVQAIVFPVLMHLNPMPFWKGWSSRRDSLRWLELVNGILWLPISLIVLIGVAAVIWQRLPTQALAVMLGFTLPVIASGMTYFSARYRLPAVGPVLCLFAVMAPVWWQRRKGLVVLAITVTLWASVLYLALRWNFESFS
ncbi:hypothetical protein ACFLQM_03285 [Acidobacteriota bacterium]